MFFVLLRCDGDFFKLVCLFSSDLLWFLGFIKMDVYLNVVWWINWIRLFEIVSLLGMWFLLNVVKLIIKYEF